MRELETNFLFVGENPSKTAREKRWTWESGRLAAKQLFDALIQNGFDPKEQIFVNLFRKDWKVSQNSVELIEAGILEGITVVAMGQKVKDVLAAKEIRHLEIVHPAARGVIRKKERYSAHIKDKLLSNPPSHFHG